MAEEEASKERIKNIRIAFAAEAIKEHKSLARLLLVPLYIYTDILATIFTLFTQNEDQVWEVSIRNRMLCGLPFTDEQNDWINRQNYRRREFFRNIDAIFKKRGLLTLFFSLNAITNAVKEADNAALAQEVEIQKADSDLLQRFAHDVRGNPRSVKRFINTYQLAKGICAELSQEKLDLPNLESLAAWLVVLQNWPLEGGFVLTEKLKNRSLDSIILLREIFQDEGTMESRIPRNIRNFFDNNSKNLEELFDARNGTEIPRCFSFITHDGETA